jgi:hypothetical protein
MSTLAVRQTLLTELRAALEPLPSVYAAWLEGADASRRADDYSDLDLWLDVQPGQEENTFGVVRNVVQCFGSLDVEQIRTHPHPLIQQRFYHSRGLPRFLFVDVCVQTHGREVTFGPADVFLPLFDRGGVLRRAASPVPDVGAQVARLLEGRWRSVLVEKELARGHILEALAYYHVEVLEPLVRLLRLRHSPDKGDYGLKHVSADLPAADVQRLEALYDRTRPSELREGMEQAHEWMDALARAWP